MKIHAYLLIGLWVLMILIGLFMLAGCGGGGEGEDEAPPPVAETPRIPPPPPAQCFTTVPSPDYCPPVAGPKE